MNELFLISTVHEEMGNANEEELCLILEKIKPDLIFLEALESSYNKYDQLRFENFDIYSSRIELKALQIYGLNNEFEYVPVLDEGMSNVFEEKFQLFHHDFEFQKMLINLNELVSQEGFGFLNSEACQLIHREMRKYEDTMIPDFEIKKQFNDAINEYEDSMVKNIKAYCEYNQFNRAVFMFGNAHRESILEKFNSLKDIIKVKTL